MYKNFDIILYIFLNNTIALKITYLANSITATCRPRQIPKNGLRFSRHHLHASILPSTPLVPKPPGTITPLVMKNKIIYKSFG